MLDDAAELPTPSRRSIPPVVADWATEAPLPPPRGTSWSWVLGTLWLAAMIPLGLHWYGSEAPVQAAAPPSADETRMAAAILSHGRVVVPEASVTAIDGKPAVFVAEQALHLLVATPVALGASIGADREILSGVTAGQMVVTDGLPALRATASR
jgi:hypothetical protein